MIAAPTQQDRAAWKDTRIGRFTASKFGALMKEPQSFDAEAFAHLVPREEGYTVLKSGPRKGEEVRVKNFNALAREAARKAGKMPFSAEGTGYIFAKAIERLTGVPVDDAGSTPVMRRGLLLEPAALHILSTAWKPCEACTWQAYGDNLGSTPDALVEAGHATMDLKCPGNPADVVRFADEVVDGDFDTLLAWDSTYAWQVMVQALTCGCDTAHLVYFTDRLPINRLTDEQLQEAQTLIDLRAEQYSQESIYPWSYTYGSDGYYFAARSFRLTDEIKERILSALERAEAECQAVMLRCGKLLVPTPEEVEATAPGVIDAGITEPIDPLNTNA